VAMHGVSLTKQAMHRAHKLGAVQAVEDGEEAVNHSFIRQALQPLVSMLLDQLTKQEPGQDRDEGIWNLSMAAGTCLGLVAQCVKDEIVSLVMPYVQVGITPAASVANVMLLLLVVWSVVHFSFKGQRKCIAVYLL